MNRPFDAKRYRRLLEGLDATEVRLSALERTKRIDAEFFSTRHLHVSALLTRTRTEDIASLAMVSDGNHFAIADQFVEEDGVPYYRGQDGVGHAFIEQSAPRLISQKAYDAPYMARSHLHKGDVLLTIVGTIGETSLVTSDSAATCSCKLAILRSRGIAPEYLAAYLRSELGRSQTERYTRGAVQMGLPLEDMDQIRVARLSSRLEQRISELIEGGHLAVEAAYHCLAQAEITLTTAIGLDGWQLPQPLAYTRRASKTFAAGRLDSEYYEPAYAELRAHVRRMGGACLGDLVAEKIRRGISPEYVESGDLPVINSQHVGKERIALESTRTTRKSLVLQSKGARTGLVKQWDVLLNSTGRITIGRCQCLLDDVEAVVDNHVSIIRPSRGIDPVYLACFLNSRFGLMQTEQSHTGSSGQIEMRPELIENFEIWIAPKEVQRAIRERILEAHTARHNARGLLAAAQRAVEIAIEQDEAAALAHLAGFGITH